MRKEIRRMIDHGVFDQNVIFKELYPRWTGHYSTLRDMIADVKNRMGNH